jgi:hypothetical protein
MTLGVLETMADLGTHSAGLSIEKAKSEAKFFGIASAVLLGIVFFAPKLFKPSPCWASQRPVGSSYFTGQRLSQCLWWAWRGVDFKLLLR